MAEWESRCLAGLDPCEDPVVRGAQLQADVGLSVIQAAYEHPLGDHVSASLSAGVFGSYFLPRFNLGDNVLGIGGGARVTWFQGESGRGLYVAPYVRVHRVSGDHDGMDGTGLGVTSGAFVGWAFGLGDKLDLRIGAGAQYIWHSIDTGPATYSSSTPFVALDLLLGYRL
jgi:hypothetical protein